MQPQAKQAPKSNSERQRLYRLRQKEKLGEAEFKQQHNEQMKAYRKQRKEAVSVDEQAVPKKQTRDMITNLLKTVEQRIIAMVNDHQANPQIPIHFENYIRKDEIEPVLISINNTMTNEEVVNAFVENERKNPRFENVTADRDTFIGYLNGIDLIRRRYYGIDEKKGKKVVRVYNDLEFLKDTNKVVKILEEDYPNPNSHSTMVNNISSILGRLANYNKEYINVYLPLNKKLKKNKQDVLKNRENTLNEKEKKSFLSWDKILALEEKVKEIDVNPVESLAIYYLYTTMPPRRLEYGSLKIEVEDEFKDDGKTNYVVLNPEMNEVTKFILNDYKTSKKYGKYTITEIDPKLSNAIITLIQEQNYTAGEYLFMNSQGKPYKSGFSNRVKEVFMRATNVPVTLNTLRHSYISYHLKGQVTTNQKEKLSKKMGHSITMQDLYRRFE